ncbi:ribonuclease H-like domain-containing protein [Tanacetum coccineum]
MIMEGVDRLNELKDEMLVNNIMSRLDCTTKEVIKTTATISKRWKNLWTSLPHLIFSDVDDVTETDLHGYMSFIDNTLIQCPTNLNLKKFKLNINYSSWAHSDFELRANSWISYAISRNVEDVDLRLWDVDLEAPFSYDDEVFFNSVCFIRVKMTWCLFNPPNGAISWERLECLCLSLVTLDEDMIEKILSGSPSLESLELNACYGYRRIDITSKSVRKLVFSEYTSPLVTDDEEAYIDCIRINAPYISSLTIEKGLLLRELVLLNVSSLVEADLDFSIYCESRIEEIFRGLLESLGHVEDITLGDRCLKLLSRLEAVDDDQVEIGVGVLPGLIPLVARGLLNVPFAVALQKCQLQFMRAQDKRLKSTSEILNNMKIIKLQSCLKVRRCCKIRLQHGDLGWDSEVPLGPLLTLKGTSKKNHNFRNCLADENESVREAALGAGHILVEHYAISSLPPLLPAEEDGIFNDNWRIRQSSVELLSDLLFKVAGSSGKHSFRVAATMKVLVLKHKDVQSFRYLADKVMKCLPRSTWSGLISASQFARRLPRGGVESNQYADLMALISNVELSDNRDGSLPLQAFLLHLLGSLLMSICYKEAVRLLDGIKVFQ